MNKYLKVLISAAIAALFLWLAFRNVEFSEIVEASKEMSWGWLPIFAVCLALAHYIRAERWRMLFNDGGKNPHRFTLFTGVMFGYLTNIPFPRLGEITRPVYVARQIGESNSKIIGTIVLERIVDVLSMLVIMAFVGFFMVSDTKILLRLFGVDKIDTALPINFLKWLVLVSIVTGIAGFLLFKLLVQLSTQESKIGVFIQKTRAIARGFFQGMLAIKKLKNWPLFIIYTALIWFFLHSNSLHLVLDV